CRLASFAPSAIKSVLKFSTAKIAKHAKEEEDSSIFAISARSAVNSRGEKLAKMLGLDYDSSSPNFAAAIHTRNNAQDSSCHQRRRLSSENADPRARGLRQTRGRDHCHRGRRLARWLRRAPEIPRADCRMGRPGGGLCVILRVLFVLPRTRGVISGGYLCSSATPQEGNWYGTAGRRCENCLGGRVLLLAMGSPRLEQARNRVLQTARRGVSGRVAFSVPDRRCHASCHGKGGQMSRVRIIGAGLAGSEAAWQCAQRGLEVDLFEMRPVRSTPAHQTSEFAELVCSNSLKSESENTAPWLLKEEMRRAGSLLIEIAKQCAVPAGHALAVDRTAFSAAVTERLSREPAIRIHREEATRINEDELTIVATGPLTSDALAEEIARLSTDLFNTQSRAGVPPPPEPCRTGMYDHPHKMGEAPVAPHPLYFYDSISPIVEADSIDMSKVYLAARYDKGSADYINCPISKE